MDPTPYFNCAYTLIRFVIERTVSLDKSADSSVAVKEND